MRPAKPVVLNTNNGEVMKEEVREKKKKQDEAMLPVCGWQGSLVLGSGETKPF